MEVFNFDFFRSLFTIKGTFQINKILEVTNDHSLSSSERNYQIGSEIEKVRLELK